MTTQYERWKRAKADRLWTERVKAERRLKRIKNTLAFDLTLYAIIVVPCACVAVLLGVNPLIPLMAGGGMIWGWDIIRDAVNRPSDEAYFQEQERLWSKTWDTQKTDTEKAALKQEVAQ